MELARNGDVLVVTKDAPSESSTEYAQGGVAVALSDEDEISIHFDDTIKAGDGLCNRKAVGTLVEEGPMRIRELIVWGAEFDQEGSKLAFTQEAAHSKRRILHAQGDSTGHEILRVLIDKVRSTGKATKIDFAFTTELIIDKGSMHRRDRHPAESRRRCSWSSAPGGHPRHRRFGTPLRADDQPSGLDR